MKRPRPARAPADRGAALIMVLAMLAVMSTLAVVVVDASRLSFRRTANQTQMEQARWYAVGAERFAIARLKALNVERTDIKVDQADWLGREIAFPLDDGMMTVALADASNCFNLNSVVRAEEGGGFSASARGQVQFGRLLAELSIPGADGVGLVAALTDWIDSDTLPGAGGVEDFPADPGQPPYRPANTLLADVGELQAVRGFTAEVRARLAPYVCVRSNTEPMTLNVNTLQPEADVLLAAALGPTVSPVRAREFILKRPRGGWESVEAFLNASNLGVDEEVSEALRGQFRVRSTLFVLVSRVRYQDARESAAALVSIEGSGQVIRRVFGAGLTERSV